MAQGLSVGRGPRRLPAQRRRAWEPATFVNAIGWAQDRSASCLLEHQLRGKGRGEKRSSGTVAIEDVEGIDGHYDFSKGTNFNLMQFECVGPGPETHS